MRALIVGLGAIGRRHRANLEALEPSTPVVVWHQHSRPSDRASADVEIAVYGLEDALATQPDFALVTGPASTHVDTALALADHGVHLLVEKPLSNRLDGVDALIARCREKRLALLVAYNFRFYRPLQLVREAVAEGRIGRVLSIRAEVGQYLPEWRPGSDYRQSVSARAELGGGALLELSHEIDYARWLVGEVREVSARAGHVSDLEMDVEDLAEVVLEFENGAIGSLHMDMVQRSPTRTCRIVGSTGTLVWDGMTHHVGLYSSDTGAWTDLWPAAALDRNDMYVAELRHFLSCVRGDAVPEVTGEDGRRVLEIALAAKASSRERRAVAV